MQNIAPYRRVLSLKMTESEKNLRAGKTTGASPLSILIVDDELNIRKTLTVYLETEGHNVVAVSNLQDAVHEASRRSFDLAFVDLRLGTADGLDLIPALLAQTPWLKIIVITAYASIGTAVEAMRRGATDYIPKPFTPAQVKLAVHKVFEMRTLEQRVALLQEDLGRSNPEVDFSTASPAMQRVINLSRQIAPTETTVLLRGESGTGKTALARAIHHWSHRAHKPFCVVSCPTFSSELLESELFGHVKGAFTGAVRDNPGRIAACEGGTLLLDEISDLPPTLQPKLLRFLQDKEYERVGDYTTRKSDVRIIAATNTDLEKAVKEGRFREDLFYRLNVIQIEIPPLHERPEDIAPLAERLLAFFGRARHHLFLGFTHEALRALAQYRWPGNVRELRNVIERVAILCQADHVGIECLPASMLPSESSPRLGDQVSLEKIEEEHIRRVLATSKSLQEAADVLGIDQATLWRRRKKYNI
jgi:NtrC-family two-component system response regulator AlgB